MRLFRKKLRKVLFVCPICGHTAWDWPTSVYSTRKYCVCGTYMQEHSEGG